MFSLKIKNSPWHLRDFTAGTRGALGTVRESRPRSTSGVLTTLVSTHYHHPLFQMKKLTLSKAKALAHDHQAELGLTLRPSVSPHPSTPPSPQHRPRTQVQVQALLLTSCVSGSCSTSLVLDSTSAVCAPHPFANGWSL